MSSSLVEPAVPFAEPPWLNGMPSPYYKETHIRWQKTCREFIDENLNRHAMEWETQEMIPASVYETFFEADMLLPCLPAPLPAEFLRTLGKTHLRGGLPITEFDNFHGAIFQDTMLRSGLMGPPGAITTGVAFAIPPIYKFGSVALQNKFLPDLLTGRKRICIAITEPTSGSDVAGTSTTAVKSADGKYYVVNGMKKW
jgi:acyl-CoA dehydrogenase